VKHSIYSPADSIRHHRPHYKQRQQQKEELNEYVKRVPETPIFTRLIIKVFTNKSVYNNRTYTASIKDSITSTLDTRENRFSKRFKRVL
jgi:hypothetical protein